MRNYLFLLFLLVTLSMMGQKRPLDHSVYDGWKSVSAPQLTPDGKFAVFEVNPQEGDGMLVIHRNKDGRELVIPRGYRATIAADGTSVTMLVKAPFRKILAARKKNVKKDKMPQDSVAFVRLSDMSLSNGEPSKATRPDSYRSRSWLMSRAMPHQKTQHRRQRPLPKNREHPRNPTSPTMMARC